jgi:hypothetical protein
VACFVQNVFDVSLCYFHRNLGCYPPVDGSMVQTCLSVARECIIYIHWGTLIAIIWNVNSSEM